MAHPLTAYRTAFRSSPMATAFWTFVVVADIVYASFMIRVMLAALRARV